MAHPSHSRMSHAAGGQFLVQDRNVGEKNPWVLGRSSTTALLSTFSVPPDLSLIYVCIFKIPYLPQGLGKDLKSLHLTKLITEI